MTANIATVTTEVQAATSALVAASAAHESAIALAERLANDPAVDWSLVEQADERTAELFAARNAAAARLARANRAFVAADRLVSAFIAA